MLVLILLLLNLSDDVYSLQKHHPWHPLPKCGPYEVASLCARTCPPQSCDSLYKDYYLCTESTHCRPGCNCIHNYLRNHHGVCIPKSQCFADIYHPGLHPSRRNPMTWHRSWYQLVKSRLIDSLPVSYTDTESSQSSVSVSCYISPPSHHTRPNNANQGCSDPNASPKVCPSSCQPTCDQPNTKDMICTRECLPGGCVCNPGYILSTTRGTCIKKEECPKKPNHQCSDPNASPKECPRSCQPTCDQPNTKDMICTLECLPGGCVCNPGYILNETRGTCIKKEECPKKPNHQCSDPNASPKECPRSCQPTCDQPNTTDMICTLECLPGGCVCNPGYILNETRGTCIKKEECPKKPNHQCSDPNASLKDCPSSCQPTCDQPNTKDKICTRECLPGGCVCNPGYILNTTRGTCIKKEECPKKTTICNGDPNAMVFDCPSSCPPTCDQPDTSSLACIAMCDPSGCVCKGGYILSKIGGQCVLPHECPGGAPKCSGNKTYVGCYIDCTNRYCPGEYSDALVICDPVFPCSPGCACEDGYLMLNSDDRRCVLASECPPVQCTRPNEIWDPAPLNCNQQRCEDVNINTECIDLSTGTGKCVCKPGYYRDTNDLCVPASECGKCNGDPNAISKQCATTCAPTCANPDASYKFCIEVCSTSGCECKPGYILSKIGGVCIDPESCPGGSPLCGENKTYVDCFVGCLTNYCPTDDSRGMIACSIAFPCPPGCACNPGYMILSYEDQRCVKSSECPPVNCTRPNEVWDPAPSICYSESCEDTKSDCSDNPGPPRCVCQNGFYRNKHDICVPAWECDTGCNGDPNAIRSACSSYCPPTCDEPSSFGKICIDACDPIGCECKPGYILTKHPNGKCVKAEECPGGSPSCDENKTYVDCFVGCPNNYCPSNDNRAMIACDIAFPCPSGCACNPGYLMLSYEDQRCVKSSECPPVNCTRPNEVWDPAPSICYSESCEDTKSDCSDNPGPPRCVCQNGFYRNKHDICVPAWECDTGCNGDPNAIRSACPSYCPPTCDEPSSFGKICIDACDPIGCECKPGYILTKHPNGKCVKAVECPGGSPSCGENKTYVDCFVGCPNNYCPSNDNRAMIACDIAFPCPPGCACNPGYLMLSYEDQRCVKSSECPPINCTRLNEVWDPTPSNGYSESCEDMNSVCSDDYPGPPRCVCKSGFYRNKNDICVPASECDTGCNGDPNAMPHSCPSFCPPTCDEPSSRGKLCIDACDPHGCVCKPGYVLTKYEGKCVKPEECPAKPLQCGLNEVAVRSRTICPPQNCEISYTDYDCAKFKNIREPGCDCLPNYLRNGSGICILNDDCPYPTSPICGINEIARDCRRICPPQTCQGRLALYKCRSDIPCEPGCDCVPNYLRNSQGVCVSVDKCDSSEPNPTCSVSDKCIRTCASPNPPNCPYQPAKTNKDGCKCMEGYILSEIGGKCIKIDDCPSNVTCNGDPHARAKRFPLPCPSTCDSPNATPCKKACEPIGCECKPGYLFSKIGGKCILPDECPGGNPCPENSEFRPCKYNCPEDYCPEDENTDRIVCDPWPTCLSGCDCRLNHRRLSYEDDRCVVASDCPPVNCTRPNEVWDGCPSDCFSGNCADREYQDAPCNTFVLNCQPKCVCKRDTFRNASGICVPATECPPLCSVPDQCRRTCSSPDPPNCIHEPSETNEDGCKCMEGYVLSDIGGTCIKIEDCGVSSELITTI